MYIHIKAVAGAKKESIVKHSPNRFSITVREPAEQNKANMRIRELVAQELNVEISAVRIINGHHTPTKLLSIIVPNEI